MDYYAVRAVVGRGTEIIMVHQTSEIFKSKSENESLF
jgi:hypothetical protein